MSSLPASHGSVVRSSDHFSQPTYLGGKYTDDSSFQFTTGDSAVLLPTSQTYPRQDAAQLGVSEGASDHDSTESFRAWDSFMSTQRGAASQCPATAGVLQPPRRRLQQERTPLPDGTLGNARDAPLINHSAVADCRRSVGDPIPGPRVFRPDGTTEISGRGPASITRYFSEPSVLGHTTSPNHQKVDDFFDLSGDTYSNQQQPPDFQKVLDYPQQFYNQWPFNRQQPLDNQQPPDYQKLLGTQQPIYGPDIPKFGEQSHMAAIKAIAPGDGFVPDSLEDQLPALTPSTIRSPQISQPAEDLRTINQFNVEGLNEPSLYVTGWKPPYGDQNFSHEPGFQPDFTLSEAVNRKKRSRGELTPPDEVGFENPFPEFEDDPYTGLDIHVSNLIEKDPPMKQLDTDMGPLITKSKRARAVSWDSDDVDGRSRSKKLRLGNGDPSTVGNASPEYEYGPSVIHEQLTHPHRLQDIGYGDIAYATMPPASSNPKVNSRPKRSHRAAKKRICRSVKQRNHGDLVIQADETYMFREFGSDVWEPTAYHEDLRGEMIDAMLSYGEYAVSPTAGPQPNDQTSFEPTQAEWRFRGHQGWHASQDMLMYRFERQDHRDPDYEPGPMRFNGYVILNKNSEVITGWKNLPLTISSSIEGGRIENIQRIDSRIAIEDFQDRMPSMVSGKPVQGRSAFTNRTMRYRLENGLASWHPRDGSLVIKNIMLRHLTADQLQHNTTKGYNGLTEAERTEIRDNNEHSGRYRSRAGKNALPRQ